MDQPTIAPEAAPQGTPDIPQLASPGAMGGEVAAALGEAGQGLGQRMLQRHEIDLRNQYEDQLTQAQLRMASLRETMGAHIDAIQRDPDLDVKTYTDRVHGVFDQLAPAVTDGVDNIRIQRQLAAQLGDMKAQYGEQAANWQTGQQAGLVAAGSQALFSKIGNQAYQVTDPAQVETLNHQIADYVHGLQGLTPDQRMQLVEQGVSQNAANFGYGLAERDPVQARALFDQGWFGRNGVKDQQLHVLDRAIGVAQRRQEGQAQAALAAQESGMVVQAESVLRTIDGGGSVPLPQLAGQAQAIRQAADASAATGKPKPELYALADRLSGAVETMDVHAKYGLMPPAQISAIAQDAAAAAAQRQAAGKPISLAEGARLTAIQSLAQQITAAVNSDPWQLAAPRGLAPVPLDPAHPESFAARASQAQQLQKVLSLPYALPPLQRQEAEALARTAAQSDAGRSEVLATLDHFDMHTRDLAARQIAPHDGSFVIEAGMDPFNRAVVHQGLERTSADSHFWTAKPAEGGPPPAGPHLAALDARVDAALGKALGQTDIAGVKQAARNWIAGMMVRQGRSNGMALTDEDVQNGLRAAMGGHVTPHGVTGGVASWGTPNNIYAVPNSMNAAGFHNFVYRQLDADRKAGRGPANPDGTPFDLAQAKPVWQEDGTYRWETPSGVVTTAAPKGQPRQLYLTRGAR